MSEQDSPSRAADQLRPDGQILRVRPAQVSAKLLGHNTVQEHDEFIEEIADPTSTSRQDVRTSSPMHRPSDVQLPHKATTNALDGGYGWVVVFGCFLMHVINVGLIKAFGIIFVSLREQFGASNADVSWIYALFLVCSTWFAPLASFLANAFSQRSVVMLGGLLLGIGISLGYFANSLMFLYFSYGCLSGLGSALSYTPAVVAVGSYFEKRRALANGISLSGAAFGSITVPYLTSYLVKEFPVSGAILICGSIALNVCVAGALLRPVSTHMRILRAQQRASHLRALRALEATLDDSSAAHAPTKAFSAPASARSNGLGSLYERDLEANTHLLETPLAEDTRKRSAHSMPAEPLSTRSHGREITVGRTSQSEKGLTFFQRFVNRFKRKEGQPPLFDFGLFRQRLFIVYALSVMLATFSYMNIFLILPAHTVDLGCTKDDAAMLIAIIGLADIFARIGYGWFSDLKLFHRKWGFCAAVCAAAVCNCLAPVATNFVGLGIYAAFLGMTSGSYISLVAVVCVDFFGIDRLSSALGSVIAFQGAAFLAGPPLIGRLRDVSGTYKYGFWALAVCLVCSASLIVVEHFCDRIVRRKPRKHEVNHDHEMQLMTASTPASEVVSPIVPSISNSVIPPKAPVAHMDEFDPLTPRPVSKPVFKPKLKRRIFKEHVPNA
ncbi:monocarboxylate transporter 12-like [Paramacrobiotus metropolitanus]|uniref:monocarboxylate transporter 12-like n=1 Tax=Paramacrobiotus metropolitanus TaxID=2943436 RepID=UPI0024465ACC|nr:monocarboxylate transporter 12-like [Paramacrobiotus metropolitanus]XP_055328714.1 monocarboxylate transporter 12-like [Paramacrobiotus metropolitanus]XP_055328715.1 monocarboxylate transporter 12-like [Paramacrobiotus metropolitanus]XP_055328717.1 monocarboxylate transporter 12-like [Paramacrobiotus metropolitanus]XP_055328718.1 monocarboxylate transporter 12-like [Paramacrobiotus metropolitanus]